MGRYQEIRDEAMAEEKRWHGRRVGAFRLALLEAHALDKTCIEAAKYIGASYSSTYIAAKNMGIKFKRSPRIYSGLANRVRLYGDNTKIEVKRTVKETAIANRGKASAEQIAAAIGTTRNAIIGHWFRARQLGLIQ